MPVTTLQLTSIVSATGWVTATTTTLNTSDNSRATGGNPGEIIIAEITDAPADYGASNSVILNAEWRINANATRAKNLLLELTNADGSVVYATLTTPTLATTSTTDSTHSSTALPVTLTLAELNAARLRVTVQEGSGMADTSLAEIDRLWITLDYTALPSTYAQDAYRFYADGTESGSTALAAENTGISLAPGTKVQARVLVQETAGVAESRGFAWQYAVGQETPALVIAVTNAEEGSQSIVGDGGTSEAGGQSFTTDGIPSTLDYVTFKVRANGSPTDGLRVQLADTLSGSVIAESDIVEVRSSTLTETTFTFPTQPTLAANTQFFLRLVRTGSRDGTNFYSFGILFSSVYAGGGRLTKSSGSWNSANADTPFAVYRVAFLPTWAALPAAGTSGVPVRYADSTSLTHGGATTARITGTGTFFAGRIYEQADTTTISVAAAGYTNLLASIELVTGQVANNDVVQLRVVRADGTPFAGGYPQVPTITASVSGGQQTFQRSVSDNAVAGDTPGTIWDLTWPADNARALDDTTRGLRFTRSAADNARAADAVVVVAKLARTAADNARGLDAAAALFRTRPAAVDNARASDAATVSVRVPLSVTDAARAEDSVDKRLQTQFPPDNARAADLAEAQIQTATVQGAVADQARAQDQLDFRRTSTFPPDNARAADEATAEVQAGAFQVEATDQALATDQATEQTRKIAAASDNAVAADAAQQLARLAASAVDTARAGDFAEVVVRVRLEVSDGAVAADVAVEVTRRPVVAIDQARAADAPTLLARLPLEATDHALASDAAEQTTRIGASAADHAVAADAAAGTAEALTYVAAAADNARAEDAAELLRRLPLEATDAAAVADQAAAELRAHAEATDAARAADDPQALRRTLVLAEDGARAADAASATLQVHASDNARAGDVPAKELLGAEKQGEAFDDARAADQVDFRRTSEFPPDTAAAQDSAAAQLRAQSDAQDAASAADQAESTLRAAQDAQDAARAGDQGDSVLRASPSLTDAARAQDAATPRLTAAHEATDAARAADQAQAQRAGAAEATDNARAADAATVEVGAVPIPLSAADNARGVDLAEALRRASPSFTDTARAGDAASVVVRRRLEASDHAIAADEPRIVPPDVGHLYVDVALLPALAAGTALLPRLESAVSLSAQLEAVAALEAQLAQEPELAAALTNELALAPGGG